MLFILGVHFVMEWIVFVLTLTSQEAWSSTKPSRPAYSRWIL